jgi:hypothetical protein
VKVTSIANIKRQVNLHAFSHNLALASWPLANVIRQHLHLDQGTISIALALRRSKPSIESLQLKI